MVLQKISEKDYGYVRTIKYAGLFDKEGLLKAMRNWIEYYGYEFHEKSVKHKVPTPAGAEQEIDWWGWRKVNDYIKYNINISLHFWNIKEVDVVRKGKTEKMTAAKIRMDMWGDLEVDWQNRFAGSKFLQALGDFYLKYIVNKSLDLWWSDQLYYHIYKLHGLVKEYLDMEAKANAFEDVW